MNSPIKWVGGKRNLANRLVSIFPEHYTYVEPFFGAGWVYFKKEKAEVEIVNDINGELINFYKVIKECPEVFCDEFELLPKSRELFDDFTKQNPSDLSNIERAVRFYYLLMLNFGGRFNRFTFSIRNDGIKQINFDRLPSNIKKAHNRLKDTYIERVDYKEIIKKWDKEDTLFYLDPPYLETTEKDYESNFGEQEYEELASLLKEAKGKFVLTVKDSEFVRELFKEFYIYEEDVFYSISKQQKRNHGELIITNYEVSDVNG